MEKTKPLDGYGNLIELAMGGWENREAMLRSLLKNFFIDNKEFEKTFKRGQDYLKRYPKNVKILIFMGHAFRIRGDFKKAIECLKKATEIEPENLENWIDLAFAYRNAGYIKKGDDTIFNLDSNIRLKSLKLHEINMSEIRKIEIVTGFSCNNNCLFCSVGDKLRSFDKTTEEVLTDIDRAVSEKPEEINFTGGEPTIRKDILKLISYTKSKGINEIRVTTNGRMFSYDKFTEDIIDSGLTGAIFSVHCPDAKLHDSLSGVKGSFEQTIKGLKNFYSHNKVIDINTVITSKSYKLLPETMEMIKDYIRSVCLIFPTIDGHLKENKFLIPTMKNAQKYIHKAIDILRDAGKQGWTLNYPVCFMKGYEAYSSMMELQTKMFWPHMDTNLDEKRKGDNILVNACKNCRYRLVCIGVMKNYVDILGEKEIKPVSGELVKSASEAYGMG